MTHSTDYLIIGAGAVGLAFADTLLDEDKDCTVTFVDKHARPGGHWNDAYGFVALHQPSASYGVNSLPFANEHVDTRGHNAGMQALATGTEVLAYFGEAMQRLLDTGRAAYFPLSEWRDGTIVALLSGEETAVEVRRKTVDATFYQTSVPSTHKRQFGESGGVEVVPPGELMHLWKRDALPEHYTILGAGKTAMDTAVWLIEAGVKPGAISWVRPRESWLLNRASVQPSEDGFTRAMDWQLSHLECAEAAQDGAEWMAAMAERGHFVRIDESAEPQMYHYATISEGEIERTRRIGNVIRDGRVTGIEPGRLRFAGSEVAVPENTLFIDCTATAVPFEAQDRSRPLFAGDSILLQPLHVPLVTFSAAVAAFIEANYEGDETKNALATPAPLTDTPLTYPYAYLMTMKNRGAWQQDAKMGAFLSRSRLDPMGPTVAAMVAENNPKLASLGKMAAAIPAAMPHIMRLGMQAKALHEAR